ncbi:glycerophosphoryl diester phosphodiesterase [Kineococcus radiotolerans]|uniref:Glycerophosphoryl diester phosphodiesterase n=1 Tax=Kineococcus radiotolerans TaxID=131568 RepID=A0A7W4TJK6_KINRA|nr:glycerophosphodiester phosphodiesterase family protein [Kineococcus radiotolerans]MBB2899501.1 glycerophosphoryl diester phosphodiesterase [Kineococcus radiotolerans]
MVPRPPARTAFCTWRGPIAMAHRGFAATPELAGLENSLPAFAAAVDLGYRYLETDVRASADGVLVAFHDERLDRVTDARGELAALPWSHLRAVRIAGREPVPRLEDVLGSFPAARFNLDVKTAAAVPGLAEVLRRTRAHGRVLVTAFAEDRRRAALAAVGGAEATSAGSRATALALAGVKLGSDALVRRALAGVDAVQVPVRHGGVEVVSRRFVDAVHRAGAQVHVWTVDDALQVGSLLDLGVDGIITDRADVLREVLLARGQWVS